MSFLENIKMVDNENNAKATPSQAIDIYNNQKSLNKPVSFYMENPDIFAEDMKQLNAENNARDIEHYKGLAKSLSNLDLYKICSDYKDSLMAQEYALTKEQKQAEYEDKWWGSRAYQQAKKSYYGMQISKLESKLHDFELGETALSENEISDIKNEIHEYYKKTSEIPEEKSGYVTTGASLVASGVEFAPELLAGGGAKAVAGAVAGSIFGPVGATVGGLAGALGGLALIYNKSKDVMYLEVKNMVDEANPNLDTETRNEYIENLSSGVAALETVATPLSLGGMATRMFSGLIKTYGLKKAAEVVANKSFKQAALKAIGETILSSAGEATEEVLQSSLIENVRPIVEQGADLTTAEAIKTAYVGLVETAQRLMSGQATEFDKQQWKTFKEVFLTSPLLSGAIQGSGVALQKLGQYNSNRTKSQANLKKTQDYKKARDNNTLKVESPEADKAILKNIIEANNIDGHVYFADSVVQNLIEESPNSEVFADAVNRMNLVEALKNSVDGTVKIDLQTANEVIFDGDGALYQELENHIMWSPDSMSPAMFEIYTDALASEVTEADQKFIDDITAKLEPTSTPDQARANALSAFYLVDALSRADPRMTREQYGRELADKISVGDIQGVNDMIVNEVEKPQTVVQKAVRKAKKVVGKVKDKLVKKDIEETIETLSASDIEEIKSATLEEVKEIKDSDFVRVGGKKMPVEYEVVELDSVQTSNDELGKINENYPQFLQNRDRSRKELLKQINTIAENIEPERLGKNVVATEGAPIVTQDGNVAVGNGRVLALKIAYNSNKVQGYKDYLASLGYNVEEFNKPVLIRKMRQSYSDETMRKFIEEANVAGTSQMSITEEALGDSSKLSVETLSLIDNEYDLDHAANRDFVKKAFNEIVPDVEQGRYLDDDNIITSAGIKRIKNAMLARILPDSRILSSILESEDEVIRKVSNALLESAYSIVSFEKEIQQGNIKPEYSILSDIQTAFTVYNAAKKSGKPVKTYLKNLDLFKEAVTPSQSTFIDMFLSLKNSGEIKNKIKDYISKATIEGSTTQENLFGDVKSKEELLGERKLYQDLGSIQGEIDINTLAIKLSAARNPTTVLHEFEHYFDLKLDAAYRDGVLQDYWLKRYRDLKKYQGAKYNPKTKEYYFESKEAERKGREKSANALTQYILEGQAPVKELQSLFQVMKDWFKMVYETIKNFPRVKLNKSITRVFDSIFAKELEVETLMRAERLGTVEKPDNVTDAQWRDYLTAKETARGASTSASIKAATELANKRSEQAYAQKKAEFYTQELADLQSDLHYQARDLVGTQKINRASIEGLTDGIKLNPKFLTKEGGLPAQFVVDNYGFNSVTEMIDFINNTNDTQTIAEQIAAEKADAWAIEQYPELINIKAENAVRNIALIKTQVYESMMLKGIPLDRFNLNYDEMILSTEKIIQGMQMKEITNLDRWQSRMRNLNEKIIVAQRKGDKKTLGDLRYRSAVLNYIILRAKAIINNKKKFDRKFDKYIYRPSPSQLKRIEGNVWDMIHSVLFNFGFTQRQPVVTNSVAERLTAYINDLQSKNFTNLEGLKNQAYFLTNPEGINVANMKVEDFDVIDGSLRLLESTSKENLKYIQDEKIREYDEDVNEVVDHYEKNKISKWNENDTVKNIFLGHIGMKETLLSRLFPERLFLKYVSPFMDGLVKANKFISQKGKEILEILKPVMKYAKREYTIDGRVFTYEQLAVIMANMGNEHNMKCMAKTLGVTEEELFSIADQSPVELRDVAQKLWDMFEENSQQFKEVVERMRGTPLKMVEAKPITFSDGQTLRGGYYPANKKANTEAKDYLEENSLKTDSTFPAFYFEKERSDAVHKDLDTTFKTLETWVYKMAMTINVAEAYNNLSKITHSKRIENVMGEGAKKELTKWMGQATMPESVNKFIAMFDSLSSVAILGWNPIKFFIQMSGIIPAMKEVGVVPIVKEFLKTATNPYNIATAPWRAAKMSDYMNERYSHPEEHIADIRKMSWLDGGKTQKGLEWVSWIGMLGVNYGDAIAGQVTWKAMYEKSKAEGKTESEAISLADSMVRRTQGDTSAGSRPPALQGNFRFFNKFSSYFIGINSMLSADWTGGKRRHAIAMLAVAGILAPTAEAFISALYDWETADDEQKRKWRKKGIYSAEDYLKRKIYENSISSSASSLVPAYGIGFRTAQYWNYGKYYAPEITALTRVTNLTTMPIDVYNYLKTGDEKDYEKAFKKSFSLTPLNDESIEWLLEKLSRR